MSTKSFVTAEDMNQLAEDLYTFLPLATDQQKEEIRIQLGELIEILNQKLIDELIY